MTFKEMTDSAPFKAGYREAWQGNCVVAPEPVVYKEGYPPIGLGIRLVTKEGEVREHWTPLPSDTAATDWVVIK